MTDTPTKFELEIWKRNDDGLWSIDFLNHKGEGIREKGRHLMKSLELEGLDKLHVGLHR